MYLVIYKTHSGLNQWIIFRTIEEYQQFISTRKKIEVCYTGTEMERVLFEDKIDVQQLAKIYEMPIEENGIVEHRIREYTCVGIVTDPEESIINNIIAIKKAQRLTA